MNIIYQPKGPAGEYGVWAANIFQGCTHGCHYCFRAANRFVDRRKFHSEVNSRKNVLKQLEADLKKLGKIDEPIFLCFTCDPFPYGIVGMAETTFRAIRLIHDSGNKVRILTKNPITAALNTECLHDGDEVWTTLTFETNEDSWMWEPGAPTPKLRMEFIEALSAKGVYTGISFEPVIEPEQTLRMARRMAKCCDTLKFGKLNHANLIPEPQKSLLWEVNWQKFALDVIALMEEIGYTNYVLKDDLKAYLPEVADVSK